MQPGQSGRVDAAEDLHAIRHAPGVAAADRNIPVGALQDAADQALAEHSGAAIRDAQGLHRSGCIANP
jgi:hypothetical protein